ncbi:chromosome segregation protein SMC, partial [Bacteroidota bacterium]
MKTLIANLEGISSGSKALLENSEWNSDSKNLFADLGNTENKFRFAIEASLKNVLNNLLIENVDDLEKAVSFLKKNDLGKASFFLLRNNNIQDNFFTSLLGLGDKRKINKIAKEKSFVNWAYMVVQTDKKWQPYFENVLNRTVIISDLDSAIKLGRKYHDFNFVT